MKLPIIFVGLGMTALVGCSSMDEGDAAARDTALAVYQRVIALKAEIRKKITAEEAYYRNAADTLVEIRKGFDERRYRREADAAARERAKLTGSLSDEEIARDLARLAQDTHERMNLALAQQKELRQEIEASVQELGNLQDEYSTLERTLVKLSLPGSKSDRIREVADFIVGVQRHYKAIEKERGEAQESGATPPSP